MLYLLATVLMLRLSKTTHPIHIGTFPQLGSTDLHILGVSLTKSNLLSEVAFHNLLNYAGTDKIFVDEMVA
ncbi:MAG: hypothetical protein ACI936_001095 [Paraglaciecola sp.]|jgi:hypothetical protein